MSRAQALAGWLEHRSDRLSPLVVKEVRQLVRARDFAMSFGACLLAGVTIAFFGAADALTGQGTTGGWTFAALTACLAFLGLAVVPLSAFTALRHERAEQTLDSITLTALSPRRVVIGKLLAQCVKLATLFAVMAPFVAMSFLLGGIDLVTILVSLALLFMWSVWLCAACVFLSTLFKSRAMSSMVFGVIGLLVVLILVVGRAFLMAVSRGTAGPISFGPVTSAAMWWTLAILATFWLTSLANFVLLAENRLTLPTEDRVTKLRVGFFVQFALIAVWALAYVGSPSARHSAFIALATTGGLQLALVALFTVTEDLAVSRRVRLRLTSGPWRGLLALFGPGGGRGAAYVVVQMAILIAVAGFFQPSGPDFRRLLAICAFILFFTGIPTLSLQVLAPARVTPLKLRVAILVFVALLVLLPDLVHYILVRPDVLDLTYSMRHLLNPFRTLDNWRVVEAEQWLTLPFVMGVMGVLAYAALIVMGKRARVD